MQGAKIVDKFFPCSGHWALRWSFIGSDGSTQLHLSYSNAPFQRKRKLLRHFIAFEFILMDRDARNFWCKESYESCDKRRKKGYNRERRRTTHSFNAPFCGFIPFLWLSFSSFREHTDSIWSIPQPTFSSGVRYKTPFLIEDWIQYSSLSPQLILHWASLVFFFLLNSRFASLGLILMNEPSFIEELIPEWDTG